MAPDAAEFLLDEREWPATLADTQRDLLRGIVAGVRRNPALVGLTAAGSFRSGAMDEFSDLDLVSAVRAAVALYRELRDRDGSPKLRRSRAAEAAAVDYLDAVARKLREANALPTPD